MSRVCQITGKKSQKGNKITKAWGVKYRTIRFRQPNLVKTTVLVDGIATQVKIAAKTLKSIKLGRYSNISMPVWKSEEKKS